MRAGLRRALEKAFELSQRAYPRAFRNSYGGDDLELFRDQLTEAADRAGTPAMLRVGLLAVLRSLSGAPGEHRNASRRAGSGAGWIHALSTAWRALRRSPTHTFTVVLTLGLGIGANVALFSLIDGVLLAPLPFPEQDQLVRIWATNPDVDQDLHGPSPLDFVDWTRESRSFESMAAWFLTSATYRADDWVEEVRSAQVSRDFFKVLGVRPLLGRDFGAEDADRYGPIVLSHGLWVRRFGAEPAVIGSRIEGSGRSYEIVGVMPREFSFPQAEVEAWIAWDLAAAYVDNPDSRSWRFLDGIGRLEPGTDADLAEQDLASISSNLALIYPTLNRGWTASVGSLREDIVGHAGTTLGVGFGATLLILLIACANVAGLMMARIPARVRDLAIRTALGASRAEIVRTLTLESVLLALFSGMMGLGIGHLLLQVLVRLGGARIPRLAEVAIDGRVLGFAIAIAALTSLLAGMAPAMHALRHATARAASAGGRSIGGAGQRHLRELFVSGQVAVAVVLLTGAALFSISLNRVLEVDPGFDAAQVASFRVSLDPVDGTPEEIVRYYRTLLDRIEQIPGVVSAGGTQALPMSSVTNDFQRPYRAAGAATSASEASTAQMRIVTPGYTEAMGMRFLSGGPLPGDAALNEPLVAIINQTLADRLWPEGVVPGEAIEVDFRDGWLPYVVVGVVADVKHRGLRAETQPEIYLSHRQSPYLAMTLVARTTGDPEALFGELEEVVLTHLPMQPAHAFASLAGLITQATAEERFLSWLLKAFSGIALFLATTGVYGVVSLSVSQRRREMGLRMALGAQPATLVFKILAGAGWLAAWGLLAGIIGVLALGGLVEGLLFGVRGVDPVITAGVSVLLLAISMVAAAVAARRAALVQPTEALRSE